MTSRQRCRQCCGQRLMPLVVLGGLAALAALQPAHAKGGGHGFGGRGFTGHVSRPILSHGVRRIRPHALGVRRSPFRQPTHLGFPGLMGYDQGPYYYVYAYPGVGWGRNAPAEPAAGPEPNQPVPVFAYRPGCRTTTQTVPAESGGTSTINVTRCY